jgi:hypothetical protein
VSRLDSFIRRMQAQRACLDWAAAAIADVPGLVLELGLGNGRTYDHLRERLPDRDIRVFDRRISAHPGSVPPREQLILGEATETLPAFAAGHGRAAALIHSDLGNGEEAANQALATELGPILAPLLAPGGIVVANIALSVPGWTTLPEPGDVKSGRYFLYRGDVG